MFCHVWTSRFSAVYQCNSCATDSDVDLSKTELVFRLRMDRNFYGPTSYIMSMSVSSVAVSAKINKLILLTF